MDSSRQIHGQVCRCVLIASVSALVVAPIASFAGGSRTAQKAQPGEIVLVRNVATRPADRDPTAPGMALMVSASPNPQLGNAIQGSGNGEITDQEIDDLTAGIGLGARTSGQGSASRSFNPGLAQNAGGNNAAAANSNSTNSLSAGGGASAATGSVVDSTRNISDQITSSLSQMPIVGTGH